jgi:hypothetical protein
MVFVVQTGNGDIIERMWQLLVSARRNEDTPELWRLTDDILDAVHAFCRLGETQSPIVARFLDVPVDPTTTAPHLLCHPNVVYHL